MAGKVLRKEVDGGSTGKNGIREWVSPAGQ
jgi:hypothetical protein